MESANSSPVDVDEKRQLYLSYNWADREMVWKIRDRLTTQGFTVWDDTDDQMAPLDTMAHVATCVENSSIILVCMSEQYKDSPNCRTEAEYAFKLQKHIMPLKLQPGYRPEGWLGFLIGSKYIYNFSRSDQILFDHTFQDFVLALRSHGITPDQRLSQTSGLPAEISRMDDEAVRLYKEALAGGVVHDHDIRIMIIGHASAGKTTLTKRILQQDVDIHHRSATDGIEVHAHSCRVNLHDGQWEVLAPDGKSTSASRRLAKLLKDRSANDSMDTSSEIGDESSGNQDLDSNISGTEEMKMMAVHGKERKTATLDVRKDAQKAETDKDEKIKREIKDLMDAVKSDPSEEADVSIWDFAGQSLFYATHQVFLSPRAVYLLVTDISLTMDDTVQDDNCFLDSRGSQSCKTSDFIDFWLNSIVEYCKTEGDPVARFILVGSKVDLLKQEEKEDQIDEYFEKVYELPSVQKCVEFIAEDEFAIDNSVADDPKITELRKKIVEVASTHAYWGRNKPAKWISLEKALSNMCHENVKVIRKTDVENMGQSMPVPLNGEEVDVFLRFHHNVGTLIFFSELGINDHVLLDPQWLVDALKCVITFKEKRRRRLRQPKLLAKLDEFEKTAVLDKSLIEGIWNVEKTQGFIEYKDYLINLMVKLNLLAQLPADGTCTHTAEEFTIQYLVPSMLKETAPVVTLPKRQPGISSSTQKLCIRFPNKFFPVAIFNQLVAACASKWKIVCQNKKMMIFCGCGIFEVEHCHWLTLYFWEQVVQFWVTRFGTDDNLPVPSVCKDVMYFVLDALQAAGLASHDIEQNVKCPDMDLDCAEGLFPVSELEEGDVVCSSHECTHVLSVSEMLRGWFENSDHGDVSQNLIPREDCRLPSQERFPPLLTESPGSFTGESDDGATNEKTYKNETSANTMSENFCKLVTFILDICPQPLRKLFIQEAQKDPSDSYASLDVYLMLKKQSVFAIRPLYQSQKDLLFPPDGSDTDITQWDITLLSALLLNLFPNLPKHIQDFIKELRKARNDCQHTSNTKGLDTKTFKYKWDVLEQAAGGIAAWLDDTTYKKELGDKIKKLKHTPLQTGLDSVLEHLDSIESGQEAIKKLQEGQEELIKYIRNIEMGRENTGNAEKSTPST